MTTRIPVTVRFCSDWHVGQGAGRPKDLDAMVRRDSDGYPYLPAKTLVGMWRDACERVATGLDRGNGGWSKLVVSLFGSEPKRSGTGTTPPVPARIFPSPCRYPAAVKAQIGPEVLTFPKIEVRIDSGTGAAMDDHLRTAEMARAGSELEGAIEVDFDGWNGNTREAALALLRAGLVELKRAGGKRRRGAGRVEVEAVEGLPELREALAILDNTAPNAAGARTATSHVAKLGGTSGSQWYEADLVIELHQPLVAADRTVGNVVTTRDFVPGTFLMGPVVAALPGGWQGLLGKVQAGELRILNAYREVADRRGLPVPHCLFYEKGKGGLAGGGTVWNRLKTDPPGNTQAVQHRRGYVAGDGAPTLLETVPVGAHTHGTIDDSVQRPTEAVGGVYTYEAIEPTVAFRSKVLIRTDQKPDGFEVSARLGTSK